MSEDPQVTLARIQMRHDEESQRLESPEPDSKEAQRARLEAEYGQVWDTSQLTNDFDVLGFAAPLVVVVRKSTNEKGSLKFIHDPRLYYGWEPHKS